LNYKTQLKNKNDLQKNSPSAFGPPGSFGLQVSSKVADCNGAIGLLSDIGKFTLDEQKSRLQARKRSCLFRLYDDSNLYDKITW
jgi:hypothetical protein